MKREELNTIPETDEMNTRRAFLKKAASVIALFVFPSQYCSDGSGGDDDARPCISFEVTFSTPMDRASVENALSIDPAVDGFFSGDFIWSNGDATVYYKGNVPLKGQSYTITIAGTAANKDGNFLDGNADGTGGDAYGFEVTGV